MSQGVKCNIDKAILEDLYFVNKMSLSDVSRVLGVSVATVRNYLLKYELGTRNSGEALTIDLGGQRLGDWLVQNDKARPGRHLKWRCICTLCDSEHWVTSSALQSGRSKRCKQCALKILRKGYESLSGTHWRQILVSAESRNIPVEITAEYAWNLYQSQNGLCKLSGMPIVFGYRAETTASLDRIDNTIGYNPGNVQWIHKDINRMKWAHRQDYFVSLCVAIANTYTREAAQPNVP